MQRITSYLNLQDRLSQVWLNTYTIALLLAMMKLIFFSTTIRNAIGQSETYVIAGCHSIDSIYNKGLNDTPHYLGLMGNYLMREALEQSLKASLKTLSLLVYASEELISFSIDLYLGTYACLLISAIDGTVDIATNTTEKIIGVVDSTVSGFADQLDDGLDGISKVINKMISAASKIESLFKGDGNNADASDNLDKVNLTISSLRDFHISPSINEKLQELSDSTPDFATVKNMTKALISKPFEQVRGEIDAINYKDIAASPELLYVPPLGNASTMPGVCGRNVPSIRKFYSSLDRTLLVTTVVCVVLIVLAAVLMMLPVVWCECRFWRRLTKMRDQCETNQGLISQEKASSLDPFRASAAVPSYNLIEGFHNCFYHWHLRVANWLMAIYTFFSREEPTALQKVKVQWIVSYATSQRALCVLGIGLVALAVCVLQIITITVLRNALNNDESSIIQTLLSSTNVKAFEDDINVWSHQTNLYINSTEENMNQHVFKWIDTTTVSINDTVNKMMSGIDDAVADVFNGTLLYSPMNTVVSCAIGNKLVAVEKAMTWINDKAKFSLPRVNASDINAALQQEKVALEQDGSDRSTSLLPGLKNVIDEMRSALSIVLDGFHRTAMWELGVALTILSIWVAQIPLAIAIVVYRSLRSEICMM